MSLSACPQVSVYVPVETHYNSIKVILRLVKLALMPCTYSYICTSHVQVIWSKLDDINLNFVKGLGTSTNQLVCLIVDCIEH
jgi:hypothetical protein